MPKSLNKCKKIRYKNIAPEFPQEYTCKDIKNLKHKMGKNRKKCRK